MSGNNSFLRLLRNVSKSITVNALSRLKKSEVKFSRSLQITGRKGILGCFHSFSQTPTAQSLSRLKATLFTRYLLPTNLVICSLGSAVSDVACQRFEMVTKKRVFDEESCQSEDIDWGRVARFGACGFLLGPMCHYWYVALDAVFTGAAVKTIVHKLIVDTLVFSPVYIVSFFWVQGQLNFLPEGSWLEEVKDRGWQCFLAEAVLWGPIQYINFRFLSTRYRVAYDASVSFLFDIYYSFIYNKKIS